MTIEEIEQVLHAAAAVRFPRIDKDAGLTFQVEQVQDHLVETAVQRGQLEEARLFAYDALYVLRDEWDELPTESYEEFLVSRRPTNVQVEMAKAVVRDDLHVGIKRAKRLIDRLTDQIKRLELDDKAASRAYTMLTGS